MRNIMNLFNTLRRITAATVFAILFAFISPVITHGAEGWELTTQEAQKSFAAIRSHVYETSVTIKGTSPFSDKTHTGGVQFWGMYGNVQKPYVSQTLLADYTWTAAPAGKVDQSISLQELLTGSDNLMTYNNLPARLRTFMEDPRNTQFLNAQQCTFDIPVQWDDSRAIHQPTTSSPAHADYPNNGYFVWYWDLVKITIKWSDCDTPPPPSVCTNTTRQEGEWSQWVLNPETGKEERNRIIRYVDANDNTNVCSQETEREERTPTNVPCTNTTRQEGEWSQWVLNPETGKEERNRIIRYVDANDNTNVCSQETEREERVITTTEECEQTPFEIQGRVISPCGAERPVLEITRLYEPTFKGASKGDGIPRNDKGEPIFIDGKHRPDAVVPSIPGWSRDSVMSKLNSIKPNNYFFKEKGVVELTWKLIIKTFGAAELDGMWVHVADCDDNCGALDGTQGGTEAQRAARWRFIPGQVHFEPTCADNDLTVNKTVNWNGALGDQNINFTIVVSGTDNNVLQRQNVGYQGGTLNFSNLPDGNYSVYEENAGERWSATIDNGNVTLNGGANVVINIVNDFIPLECVDCAIGDSRPANQAPEGDYLRLNGNYYVTDGQPEYTEQGGLIAPKRGMSNSGGDYRAHYDQGGVYTTLHNGQEVEIREDGVVKHYVTANARTVDKNASLPQGQYKTLGTCEYDHEARRFTGKLVIVDLIPID
jgi:hypothetical protein